MTSQLRWRASSRLSPTTAAVSCRTLRPAAYSRVPIPSLESKKICCGGWRAHCKGCLARGRRNEEGGGSGVGWGEEAGKGATGKVLDAPGKVRPPRRRTRCAKGGGGDAHCASEDLRRGHGESGAGPRCHAQRSSCEGLHRGALDCALLCSFRCFLSAREQHPVSGRDQSPLCFDLSLSAACSDFGESQSSLTHAPRCT